mmetsp:Transcript_19920/g.46528  ORF Transcript_19920/g.46528 Transcript_19920/m.46528 type:complete len:238 (-) Transcript_19920:194-907(-)
MPKVRPWVSLRLRCSLPMCARISFTVPSTTINTTSPIAPGTKMLSLSPQSNRRSRLAISIRCSWPRSIKNSHFDKFSRNSSVISVVRRSSGIASHLANTSASQLVCCCLCRRALASRAAWRRRTRSLLGMAFSRIDIAILSFFVALTSIAEADCLEPCAFRALSFILAAAMAACVSGDPEGERACSCCTTAFGVGAARALDDPDSIQGRIGTEVDVHFWGLDGLGLCFGPTGFFGSS